MSNIPSFISDSIETAPLKIPTNEELDEIREKAAEFVNLEMEIKRLESTIEEMKNRYNTIKHRELPEIFNRIGLDRIGLPDSNVDVCIGPYYKASIPNDWDDSRKNAAFTWLEDNGHQDVIKATVSASFKKGKLDTAREIQKLISKYYPESSPQCTVGVHWQTLTSLVKELTEQGKLPPLETLGAFVGYTTKISSRS